MYVTKVSRGHFSKVRAACFLVRVVVNGELTTLMPPPEPSANNRPIRRDFVDDLNADYVDESSV